MGDLVCARISFISKPVVREFFSLTYKAIEGRYFLASFFFTRNQSPEYFFFPEITQLLPSKVKWSVPDKGEVQVTVNGILSLQRFARVDFLINTWT